MEPSPETKSAQAGLIDQLFEAARLFLRACATGDDETAAALLHPRSLERLGPGYASASLDRWGISEPEAAGLAASIGTAPGGSGDVELAPDTSRAWLRATVPSGFRLRVFFERESPESAALLIRPDVVPDYTLEEQQRLEHGLPASEAVTEWARPGR